MVRKYNFSLFRIAAVAFIVMLLFGYGYPTIVSVIDMHIDPGQADGSLIIENNTVYGSVYLAEAFNGSEFFHPRPSAVGYNLSDSGVPNYSIDNPALLNLTKEYIREFQQNNPGINLSEIPYSMVAYSGSGLDPDIPLSGAYVQIHRVAGNLTSLINGGANQVSEGTIQAFLYNLVNSSRQETFPVFGTYYANTLKMDFAIMLYLKNTYSINLF